MFKNTFPNSDSWLCLLSEDQSVDVQGNNRYIYVMQTNVHCFMLFNTILLNVAQHVSSLYKAHLQGLFR
jgi:hypothetical protein